MREVLATLGVQKHVSNNDCNCLSFHFGWFAASACECARRWRRRLRGSTHEVPRWRAN